jgi:hypothetical protein
MEEQTIERIGDDHPETERRSDDTRADRTGIDAECDTVNGNLTLSLEAETEEKADRDGEERSAPTHRSASRITECATRRTRARRSRVVAGD